jgi:hypothetical protein
MRRGWKVADACWLCMAAVSISMALLKRNFRKSGATLWVCHGARAGGATFSEISFQKTV